MIKGLHPDTESAFDHVDAAMFSGDPSETREKFEFMKRMIERWSRKIEEVEEELEIEQMHERLKEKGDSARVTNAITEASEIWKDGSSSIADQRQADYEKKLANRSGRARFATIRKDSK